MRNPLKKQWQSLKRGQPGERFKARYSAAKKDRAGASFGKQISRVIRFGFALVSAAIGVILVFIPGPAILFFLIAGSLLASESLVIARFLDWGELRLRAGVSWLQRHWKRLHLIGKITVTALAMSLSGGCAYAAYRLMQG